MRGYYTISSSAVHLVLWPQGKPGPTMVPSILLGRLAVHSAHQKQGIGSRLMLHTFRQTLETADGIGVQVLEVNALDEDARDYYVTRFDFTTYEDDRMHIFLEVATIRQLFAAS